MLIDSLSWEMKDLLSENLLPEDLIEILDISSSELVEAFEDKILENWSEILERANIPSY